MLATSNCYIRRCKNYSGISQPDGSELSERHYCKAFLDGIPYDIAYDDNKHLVPTKDQTNEISYEKGQFEWETE